MSTQQPTLSELIAALPAGSGEELEQDASAREELGRMLAGMGSRPMPTGRLSRMWSVGSLQAKLALAYTSWWLRSGFQDAESKRRGLDETHLRAAVQVLERMTTLRGAVMKLGQVIAHWPHVAPNAFSNVLSRLFMEAPPMHFSLLREHLRRELGADPSELFDEFEETAFASASLGQVHRARLKGSGQRVAVKIQYPDIDRTIKSDVKNLKAAGFGMRFSGDWENLLAQYEGIERMLEMEVNYEAEARHLEHAREVLKDLDDVVIPVLHPEFCSKRVLTMDYIEGQHLEAFMAQHPTQELRDAHGTQIERALFRLWYSGRVIYADPHPGNFIFMPDGRLGLVDFGCCHDFSDKEFEYILDVERSSKGSEAEWRRAIAHGCDLEPEAMSEERFALMREYCDWLWQPLQCSGPFDFGKPGQFEEGVRLYGTFIKRRWTRSQPVNVWLTKHFFGARAMLTHLKARVDYCRLMSEESPLGAPRTDA